VAHFKKKKRFLDIFLKIVKRNLEKMMQLGQHCKETSAEQNSRALSLTHHLTSDFQDKQMLRYIYTNRSA
jgi:hypothetical protein